MKNRVWARAGRRRGAFVFCLLTAGVGAVWGQDIKPSGWVVIPISEYGALRAKAFPVAREAEPQPVEATLTRVEYDLRVEGDLATGHASVTVDVLRDGWVRVPIPAGLMVREARIEGRLVSLVRGAGQFAAVLRQRGRSTILLDVALPVTSAAGEEKLSLPSSASGVTRASLALPRHDLDLKVTGGLLADRSEAEEEGSWVAYARANDPLAFTWRRKMEEHRAPLPLRFRGSLTEIVGLGEDSASVYAEVSVEVAQGAARQVRVQLPTTVTVNQVPGAHVADWEVRPGELVVAFLEPVEQKASFIIQGTALGLAAGADQVQVYKLLDDDMAPGYWPYGLIRGDGTHRPAYDATAPRI